MSEGTTSDAPPQSFDDTPPPEDSAPPTDSRDETNSEAGGKDNIPVDSQGDKEEVDKDKRAKEMKDLADKIRKEEKERQSQQTDKEPKSSGGGKGGGPGQSDIVKTKQGAFGEVTGFKPRYKADADGDTYEEIKPASPFKKWMKRN